MVKRKTQIGWMALGATLCLFGAVLVVKLRDGNRAAAQTETIKASVPAVAGPLAKAMFNPPSQVAPADDSKPMAPPTLSSVFFDDANATTLPSPKKETAEPPLVQTAEFEFKEPARIKLQAKQFPPLIETEPSAKPLASEGPAISTPPVADLNIPVPPPVVVPVRFDNLAPPPLPPGFPGPLPPEKSAPVLVPAIFPSAPQPVVKKDSIAPPPVVEKQAPAYQPMPPRAVVVPVSTRVETFDLEPVKPLPNPRARTISPKGKLMPLTGTYLGTLDDQKVLTLPRNLRDQLGGEGVLVSPGSDVCLWLTTPAHLERLAERLEQSRARETDVRAFRRLYFAQAERAEVNSDGRVGVPSRLVQFAGLAKDVVLVGIDDHIEVWDAARWKRYTQEKSASARSASDLE